ncbi:alkaline-phosphatase-like protein [Catenaria anguillulae PL171]|uniref:Alkaline phosphatase n=1 Tax=Catenaria anguillulae PL171 TaxID=765915 RepID=A0A1Y2HLC3_9FUNG|nr:alkaline-phosphatase-like protein [Catenaria anguillulae PL171]
MARSLTILSLLALLALVSDSATAQYGKRPNTDPIPKPADVCESPLTVSHPGSKVKDAWPTYKGRKQTIPKGCRPKKNMIFMVSDGFGTASETIAREFHQYRTTGKIEEALSDSSDAWVTDSASAATAFSCGLKTFNAGIGVDPKKVPCATVLEAAKHKGFTTGLVATSRITHATPAGWSAHIVERDWENEIAAQQIGENVLGRSVDLMLGGGLRHFVPKSVKGSKRDDERDLLKEAVEKFGWKTVVKTIPELSTVSGKSLPLIGLFANSHMDYEIDRNKTAQPSLADMTQAALSALAEATSSCDSPGFFIMIEGSRIDHAGHANDVAAHSFVEQHPNTGALSVSDHETGGVTKAAQIDKTKDSGLFYNWHPERLAGVKASVEAFGGIIKSAPDAGIEDLIRKTVATIVSARKNKKQYPDVDAALNQLISNRAWVGWTTHGHTGMDVNLYAINAPRLRGNMDNTFLAKYSAEFLGVADVMPKLTARLATQKVDIDPKLKLRRRQLADKDSVHGSHLVFEISCEYSGLPDNYLPTPTLVRDLPATTKIVAPAYTVHIILATDTATPVTFSGNYVDSCPTNHVMLVSTPTDARNAIFGGLLATRAKHLGASGIVTNGRVRDVDEIVAAGLPAFAKGTSVQSANGRTRVAAVNVPVTLDGVSVRPGDFVVADANGVVVVPQDQVLRVANMCKSLVEVDDKVKKDIEAGSSLQEAFKRWR